ncbi:MAG TPA: cytochrome c oxidase assembly protein [Gemmatimonadales bacterium]|nr:cytochrome c oxidase assembly protein [Gemmatimonadales bacterium]
MNWWCSARDVAWSWAWQPYPGVWLFVAALVGGYAGMLRRLAPAHAPAGAPIVRPAQVAWYGYGTLALWIASDWPVGTLGSGYLLSLHTVQWILYALVAPPLLLLGVPAWAWRAFAGWPAVGPALRFLARPLPGLLLFYATMLGTHLPRVVDVLRPWQLGSFAIDMAWLAGGLALWWPVIAPRPDLSRIRDLPAIGYLFAATIVPTIPAAFMTFSAAPLYGLYELAPRVAGIPALQDQRTAGLLMKAVGDPILWLAMSVIFFRWARTEQEADRREREARRAARAG